MLNNELRKHLYLEVSKMTIGKWGYKWLVLHHINNGIVSNVKA